MADPAGGGAAQGLPPPERLDDAVDWLQRNLDALTQVTRRLEASHPRLESTPMVAAVDPGPVPSALPAAASIPSPAPSSAPVPTAPPAAASDTPLLDHLGRDLTKLAGEGQLGAVIGRQAEIDWLVEVLVRRTKRNPVLLGPAGAGKTAIVEGLAQRIAAGRVPELLRGTRLIEVPLGSLVAGTEYRGQLEERLQQLVREAARLGIILFFDEIHLLAGAGRSQGGMGADEILKPALARGEIAVVGATTPEEWRTSIELDPALARRFTTIAVAELDRNATRPILRAARDALARSRGVTASDAALDVLLDFADRRIANRRFPDKALDLLEQAVASALVAGRTHVSVADARGATETWEQRASSTPTLERFGRDLVQLARDGRLGPIVGRDHEIDLLVETLLRRTRRNPLLLGPAGSGKTAIVEGLAIRIAGGQVPEALRDVRVFDVALLQLASEVASHASVLQDLLVEARHPSVAVFFDEIHQLAAPTVHDLAQALKPALARGEIACIGATTGEEYQASLESDAALARRFTLIPVARMDGPAVLAVLRAVRDRLATDRGVRAADPVLDEVVALAEDFLPNRSSPDREVDVLEQAVAHTAATGARELTVAGVQDAVGGLAGVPLDPAARLAALADAMRESPVVARDAADALLARLGVSLRGLDSRRDRPDAVVLLCGSAAAAGDELEAVVARHVFGRDAARVDLDMAAMADDSSLSTLIGSAPGLVGSDRPLPLADLRRDPRQVVGLRGFDGAAIVVRNVVAAGLSEGHLTDSMGRMLPLQAAVVVLTAPGITAAAAPAVLGTSLLDACDVVTDEVAGDGAARQPGWTRARLLDPLAERFRRRGMELSFDDAFAAWIDAHAPAGQAAAEAFLDRDVVPRLVAGLPAASAPVRATIVDGAPALVDATE